MPWETVPSSEISMRQVIRLVQGKSLPAAPALLGCIVALSCDRSGTGSRAFRAAARDVFDGEPVPEDRLPVRSGGQGGTVSTPNAMISGGPGRIAP
ncbi:hypothetical protein ABT095_13195 [Kitasatospora sp. NPDC002227]|uniref:hypothetical protein n=1 Tax=Kitasatospora sp. NPDC002227 TaxID=3154773 RepID=UPI0033270B1C